VKPGSGFRVPGSGSFETQGSGFRVQDSGLELLSTGNRLLKPALSALNQPQPDQINTAKPGTRNPEPGTLLWADLGEAETIDHAVTAFRQVLGNRTKNISTEVKRAAQNLDKLVFQPVHTLIGPARHLLISPDGALNLIPFAALVDAKGTFLVERYTLTYLTSGRDLLRMQVKVPYQQPAMVIANPDYAVGQGPILAGRQIKPLVALPSTAKEGQEIQGLLEKAQLVIQTKATEAVVKKTKRPKILHIATHGYFLEDVPKALSTSEPRNLDFQDEDNLPPPRVENPLLRSWLFFAGANRGGDAENDGIMTALEAAQLDLWGTKLVVLSACETGVGEAKNGDGIYGLRRALVLAGSESQVMSLWNVSDRATRELMVEYYTRLKNGEGRSEALRKVQLKMLKDPQRQHPYYWAAFIQSGEWATLDGKE
ncbi:MAG TPA: CHAT domain-containing protein, partial [Acidobacteriota bacterium]|nr:CHAT domain-containing protein [Acidobacteriota bacterium]